VSQQTGYKNNNWLNVRFNANNNWVGQTGADDGGYAQFENPLYGLRAADKVLENYGVRHNINTIRGAITRFAPPSDNNPTDNYINFVARNVGISSDAEIDLGDPGIREQLISAMVRFETPDAAKEYNSNLLEQARTISGKTSDPRTTDPDAAISLFVNNQKKPAAKPLGDKIQEAQERGSFFNYATEDPIEVFKLGMAAGAQNLGANVNYFRGIAASIVGDERAKEDAILEGNQSQIASSQILSSVEDFEQFLDEPTFGGFVNQVFSATGQFAPSAFASITAAMVGAGVGAIAGATAPITGAAIAGGLTASVAKKKLVKDAVNKFMANEVAKKQGKKNLPYALTTDETNVINGAFGILQREYRKKKVASLSKLGAISGAAAQEFPQGAGTAFGIFAEQGMTDPLQAFQSLGIGVPFTAIGVGSEAIVARGLYGMATRKGGAANRSLARDILVSGALKTGAVEGVTESLQEEISIQQRFAIDDEYKQSQAKLDRAQALFSGFFGGVGIGGIGSTVASGVNRIANPTEGVFGKAREFLKNQYEQDIESDIELQQAFIDGERDIETVFPEPVSWLEGQLDATIDPTNKKDSVWIDENSRNQVDLQEASPINTKINEVAKGDPRNIVDVEGLGIFITSDPNKAASFRRLVESDSYNTTKLDSFLARNLGYVHKRKPGDNLVVEVRDKQNNVVWYQQTNENDLDAVVTKANSLFGTSELFGSANYEVSHKEIGQHLRERSEILGPRTANIEIADEIAQQFGLEGNAQATLDDDGEFTEDIGRSSQAESFSELEPQIVTGDQLGSEAAPILSQSGNPWKGLRSLSVITKEKEQKAYQEQKEKALNNLTAFAPHKEMERLIEQDAFTTSFLKKFNELQEEDSLSVFGPKQIGTAADGTPQYGILKYRLPSVGMVEAPANEVARWVEASIKADKTQEKFNRKQIDWTVLTPEQVDLNKPQTDAERINMPRLTNFGREWNNRTQAQGTMAQGGEETALLGYSTAVSSLLMEGYQLFWNGKPITELTSQDEQQAIVYTSGGVSYTAADLAGIREFEGTPQTVQTESRPRTLEQREQTLQGLRAAQIELEERIPRLEAALEEETDSTARQELDQELQEAQKDRNRVNFLLATEGQSGREAFAEQARQREMSPTQLGGLGRDPGFDTDDFGPQTAGTQEQGGGGETGAQVEVPFDLSPEQVRQREIALNLRRRITANQARLESLAGIQMREYVRDAKERGETAADAVNQAENLSPQIKELSQKIQQDFETLDRVQRNINQQTQTVLLDSTDLPGIRADIERGVGKGKKFSDTFNPLFNPRDEKFQPFKQSFSKVIEQRIGNKAFLNNILSTIKKDFKLDRDIQIITADEGFDLSRIRSTKIVNDVIKQQQVVLGREPDANGQTRPLGGRILKYYDKDFIILNLPQNPTEEQKGLAMVALAHELGHSVFEQELARSINPRSNNYAKLKAAFDGIRANTDVSQYQDDNYHAAFEEWFADQTAVYLLDATRKATNGTESIFKQIANKLRLVFNKFKQLAQRFTVNPSFSDYVQETVGGYKNKVLNTRKRNISNQGEAIIKSMVEDDIPKAAETVGKKKVFFDIANEAETILEGDTDKFSTYTTKILAPADNLLRSFGPPGVALANFFLKQSQAEGEIGFLAEKISKVNRYVSEVEKAANIKDQGLIARAREKGIVKAVVDGRITPESKKIFLEAENNLLTDDEISPEARAVRQVFSEMFDNESFGDRLSIQKIPNFFPRSINLPALENSPDIRAALIKAIVEYNEGKTFKKTVIRKGKAVEVEFTYDEKEATQLIDEIIADPGKTEVDIAAQNPLQKFSIGIARSRQEAFANVPTSVMRGILNEQGDSLLNDPEVAVRKYIQNTIKKSELNKRGGALKLNELIKELPKNKQKHAEDAVLAMLGKVNPEMGSLLKGVNNVGVTLNVLTLLSFAVFASAPDLAGPILRSKEFSKSNFANFGKEIANYFKNPQEAADFAKEVGATVSDAISTMYVNAGELDFLDPKSKKVSEGFFKVIGLDWFTRFTRIVASGMGRRFVLHHGKLAKEGNETSQRYLRELGNITWQEVDQWVANNQTFEGAVGEKIRLGIFQFVDESIVRPNSAERPVWASDPRWALVWQLKSFFYAYGKNIIGGLWRESKNRYNEEGFPAASVPFLLGAMTLLPLTMLGLDLRERFKVGLAWVLPGISPEDKNYRRSVDMDWGEYSFEIIDRSGVLGPFGLAMPLFMENKRFGDPFWVGPLGPTVERAWDAATGDFDFDSILPLYNQL